MKSYQLFFIIFFLSLLLWQPFVVEKILLRQPDEIIFLQTPQKPKGEKGSATDDGEFIKHFIGIVRNKSW